MFVPAIKSRMEHGRWKDSCSKRKGGNRTKLITRMDDKEGGEGGKRLEI